MSRKVFSSNSQRFPLPLLVTAFKSLGNDRQTDRQHGCPIQSITLLSPCVFCTEDEPSLESLWFGRGPALSDPRLAHFLSIFDCQEFSPLYGTIEEDSLLAVLCLVTHLVLQVVFPLRLNWLAVRSIL
jgi:hypothetical protein